MSRILWILCLLSLLALAAVSPAQAACRDDCYDSCCGSEPCTTDDSIACLSDCLKDCGGDNVPDVPDPTPAEPDEDSGQQQQ